MFPEKTAQADTKRKVTRDFFIVRSIKFLKFSQKFHNLTYQLIQKQHLQS